MDTQHVIVDSQASWVSEGSVSPVFPMVSVRLSKKIPGSGRTTTDLGREIFLEPWIRILYRRMIRKNGLIEHNNYKVGPGSSYKYSEITPLIEVVTQL